MVNGTQNKHHRELMASSSFNKKLKQRETEQSQTVQLLSDSTEKIYPETSDHVITTKESSTEVNCNSVQLCYINLLLLLVILLLIYFFYDQISAYVKRSIYNQ